MGRYLYLLAFSDGKLFKIGISRGNFNRVLKHWRAYDINLYESYIVTAKNEVISAFERELLSIFPEVDYNKCDGYTEIRDIKYMDEAIDIIKCKHVNLNVKVNKFFDLALSINN